MAGNYTFSMDQNDIIKLLTETVGSFTQDRLINKEQRAQHKEQCLERLTAEDGSLYKDSEIQYTDQAILANLDWGIEALEEAISTSNMETKLARFDYAEKMLQVCAMLDCNKKTAGIPNFYLSAWAHLNLSYLWKLRKNVNNSVLHVLEMFIIDPFFSRIDFASELWKELFLPHMSSIIGWYSEARHGLMMEVIPDSTDFSFTADLDQFSRESFIFSLRPDQVEKLQKLEQLYGDSLNKNTRLFAKYFKDCMNSDSTSGKKMTPMFPIVDPPMTPLHEVSRSIPDYIKYSPILPRSAGFSPICKIERSASRAIRMNVTSEPSQNLEEPTVRDCLENLLEENEHDSDNELNDEYINSNDTGSASSSKEKGPIIEKEYFKKFKPSSPTIFSPMDSPKTPSNISSPKSNVQSLSPIDDVHYRKESSSLLRLLSSHVSDYSIVSSTPVSPHKSNEYSFNSAESDGEMSKSSKNNFSRTQSETFRNKNTQGLDNISPKRSRRGSQSCISSPSTEKPTSQSRPPKDFVCPITGQILNDPVTLETGQTYERKAIQEWLRRGNTTCPITRQPLSSGLLPKTNYVLKRLITSWKDQYPELAHEFSYAETPRRSLNSPSITESSPSKTTGFYNHKSVDDYINRQSKRFTRSPVSTSPTSAISQAAIETIINGLKPQISCLCTSESLQDCEAAILAIVKLWNESNADSEIRSYLSKPTVINGFVEILSASMNREVLRTSIYILTELVLADESVGESLTCVDSDFECLAVLLKNGLAEAAVLIYLLRPTFAQLSAHGFIPSLIQIIHRKNEGVDDLKFIMDPKDSAIAILEWILVRGDENNRSINALNIISVNGIPAIIKCLDRVELRGSVVSILLCCMLADRSCKKFIAERIELPPILELFHAGNDSVKGTCINFLSQMVQLNRRTLCNQILQGVRDAGAFNTLHTFVAYLQNAPMEQQPVVASLLLQLDLLVQPRQMSIYREEAIDALVEALHRKDFPNSQMMALNALLSLTGRLTYSGKSYTEAWLLKMAGFDLPYNVLIKAERLNKPEFGLVETMEEEEEAATTWEKKVAFVLCSHDKGSIFKALEECFNSNSLEMVRSCLVVATWLIHMLTHFPDTGIRSISRKFLLDEFVKVLHLSKNQEDKILAALALQTFINDPAALEELGKYAKYVYRSLRNLKRKSVVVDLILKALINLPSVNASEMWSYSDVVELDSCTNGEVLSLLYFKGHVLSSHSDGTIKMWYAGKRGIRLVQEVHEHTKAVTCLYVPHLGDKLYSGSLDKTIRIWDIKPEEIHCLQVHNVKEAVHGLAANAEVACFISQGTGVKVYNWSGVPKHINFNKNVKCLVMRENTLFCGCSGYTIQEVDLCKLTSTTFYSGTRKFLGKQTIHSLIIQDGLLFVAGSAVDGTAGKVFCLSTKEAVGSFSPEFDIQHISVSSDFIFTATRWGTIEVWLKERFTRVASIKIGSDSGGQTKITSLITDSDGGMLYAGSSDGKIQVWALD